jgi:hypothetical protein
LTTMNPDPHGDSRDLHDALAIMGRKPGCEKTMGQQPEREKKKIQQSQCERTGAWKELVPNLSRIVAHW